MDWIRDHAWQSWLILALLLGGAEMTILDLTLLMLAVGAGAGSLMAAIGASFVVQVLVAVVVALAMLGLVRPSIVHRMHAGPTLVNTPQALVGDAGLVLERVTAYTGRVKLRGEVWSARAADERAVIEPGTKVVVDHIDGATAVVHPSG